MLKSYLRYTGMNFASARERPVEVDLLEAIECRTRAAVVDLHAEPSACSAPDVGIRRMRGNSVST
jgi:hypothetical protein